ncbi:ABC transporter ATP-binding protein [Acutalibacter muris]|uniref:ABC transporter ATP-binding protein n=1 Tax=Acutalibacter muris TaxID=1796620 RepID=A0A1Z2XVN8_9FIRM|nr:ABC transporter ATP-binding protein [Acutalibacter muris]ANU54276.1 ABC transporter ATP-binding protein [Hungateiclostridiaceae bacterium KB18]ASB42504.1 ABC transporter ATP-binding protein [Acutalibacter muris]MCI9193087.1 ABC transporter ATP-binding protein [Acutalibacter muris]MCI9544802.1 ABC transporter ATP-binding protein [Acutalibacter muris]QQR31797.1 ABC transporter ATP-binding protein [Acutalibacter muris]
MFQLRWVWTRMAGCHRRYVFALFSTAALAVLALGNSMITARIMDTVFYPLQESGTVTPEVMHQLIVLVAVLVGFVLFRTGFGYLQIMMYETCSQKLIYELRRDLYKNMQEQDQAFYGAYRTGDLMTRLTGDMDMIRHAVCWVIRQLISCTVLFFTTAITFLVTDWQFALTMLAVTPFIFFLTYMFSKRVRPLYVDVREKLSSLNTAAQENIAGNRVVKAFAREDYEIERFDEKNQAYREANKTSSLLWLKFSPYIETLSQSLSIAVLLVGGIFLINGRITIGTFTMFNGLTWTLSDPMRMLGMHLNDLQRFFASSSKIIELYYAKSTVVSRPDAVKSKGRIKGEIQFKSAGLRLHGTEVLEDIDLTVNPGETVAIMGPTGAGKTSLISLIPRFTDVTKGEVDIDGVPVRRYDLKSLRSAIGIATQDVFLFSDSVDGNIAYGDSDMSEEEVKRFAKMADVDFAEKLSEGFDTVIGERGTGLSGGQKQRIALARALAVKPSILILDDTTSAVDLETEKYIQEQLANLDFPCTKIIVAQRISTTKRADKIVVIENGRITDVGTHQELSQKPGYYREVFLLQNGQDENMKVSVKEVG